MAATPQKTPKKTISAASLVSAITEDHLKDVQQLSKQTESWKFEVYRMGCDLIKSLQLEQNDLRVGMVFRFVMTLAHESLSFQLVQDTKHRLFDKLCDVWKLDHKERVKSPKSTVSDNSKMMMSLWNNDIRIPKTPDVCHFQTFVRDKTGLVLKRKKSAPKEAADEDDDDDFEIMVPSKKSKSSSSKSSLIKRSEADVIEQDSENYDSDTEHLSERLRASSICKHALICPCKTKEQVSKFIKDAIVNDRHFIDLIWDLLSAEFGEDEAEVKECDVDSDGD